jgi:hypothetical protein
MNFPKSHLLHLLFTSLLSYHITSATSNPASNHVQPSTRTIYQFPTTPTWIENLSIVSPSRILLSLTTAPEIHILDPSTGTTKLLHTFPYLSALGITQLRKDIFYLILGNSTFTSFGSGTYSVWALNLTSLSPITNTGSVATKIADFPQSGLLNSITVLDPSKGLLAISDSGAGCIYLLNTLTRKTSILLSLPELSPPSALSLGINGLKTLNTAAHTYLYFSNTGRSLFARIPLSLSTLSPSGPVEILNSNVTIDDFALDEKRGVAWLAGSTSNALLKIGLEGGDVVEVVGGGNSTVVAGPTSVGVGEEGEVYVTTSGRFNGKFIEGGKVVRVDVGW